jgi:hypothetical protein
MYTSSRIRIGDAMVAAGVVVLALAVGACGSSNGSVADAPADTTAAPAATAPGEQLYPDVIDAVAERESAGVFSFTVTISSPYDTPDRYADGWRILGPDGTVYGEHTLTHDHANEQPFTRVQRGVAIPPGVDEVTVEGRDLEHGYGGATVAVAIDR